MRLIIALIAAVGMFAIAATVAMAHTVELYQPAGVNVHYVMHEHRDIIHGSGAFTGTNHSYGNDLIYGAGGEDELRGGYGDDDIYGGDGNDFLSGGPGVDYLNCGAGAYDRAVGGLGADVFIGCESISI